MGSRNVEYLQENPPTTAATLPNKRVRSSDRALGVWVFDPELPNKNNRPEANRGPQRSGDAVAVYYIPEEHAPEAVLQAWIDANPDAFQTIPRQRSWTRKVRNHNSEWADAAKSVWADNGRQPASSTPNDDK